MVRYLSAGKQHINVSNCFSRTVPISSAVLQGSFIGHLIFIIQLNDVPIQLTQRNAFGYADNFKANTSIMDINQNNLEFIDK